MRATKASEKLPFDVENPEMCNAYELIAKTNKSFFLTGCAGTGKTLLAVSMINSLVNAVNLDEKELSQDDLEVTKIQTLLKEDSCL